jgi:hypothetical protein
VLLALLTDTTRCCLLMLLLLVVLGCTALGITLPLRLSLIY